MAFTRGEIKGKVLRLLMKTAKYPGFYQPETIDDAIEEAMDFVATEMFEADEGWQKKNMYLDTTAGQISVDLPVSAALISGVSYRFGTTYVPMLYNQAWQEEQFANDSGVRQWSYSYQVMNNALYFNPALAEGGTEYLMLTYMAYPKRLQDDTDFLESQFDNAMAHFIKYRTASILAASIEKFTVPWSGLEKSWYDKMVSIVNTRNQQSQPIREFCG